MNSPAPSGLRAFTRNVAIPFSIATEMIANNKVEKTGIIIPEEAFQKPENFFKELEKRGILVHEKIDLLHGAIPY